MSGYQRNSVVASETEQTLATIPDTEDPGKAVRVSVEPGVEGYVRLEQLAFSPDLGWYSQKSFCVPGDMLDALVPALRQANACIPPVARDADQPLRFPPSVATSMPTLPKGRRQA